MKYNISRGEFVRLSSLGVTAGLAGCGEQRSDDSATTPSGTETATSSRLGPSVVEGRVLRTTGDPLDGATVSATVRGSETIAQTTTNERGAFTLETGGERVWVQVSESAHVGRTVAAAPDTPLRVELTPREGTVSMSFGGDVMFGRRFYEENDDSLSQRFRIDSLERRADHKEILSYVRPLLQQADVTSVNLETALTTTEWRHPNKKYSFVSDPAAAPALVDAGVDYVALGNNHVFDALTPGFTETEQTLDSADLAYSGAGQSSEQAWKPAYLEREGLTVGMLSCTTVTGSQYTVDWSADSDRSIEHSLSRSTDDGATETLQFSGDVGAAEATADRLETAVRETARNADVTVVQIHGGSEYQRTPTETVRDLTETASAAGADLVVNHHPHVTGGLEFYDSTLVAWSLGNLVFDQNLWETFQSYLLTVHVTESGVRRAYLDPLLVEGYVPKGVVAEPGLAQLRRTAALSSDEFDLGRSTFQYRRDAEHDRRTDQRTVEGDGTILARESGWARSVVDGADEIELGVDLLPTGDFDDPDVDERRYEGPLWRFGRGDDASGRGVGRDGSGGVRLTREAGDEQRAILSPIDRIPIDGPLTLTGQYQYGSSEGLELLWRWYESTAATHCVNGASTSTGRATSGDVSTGSSNLRSTPSTSTSTFDCPRRRTATAPCGSTSCDSSSGATATAGNGTTTSEWTARRPSNSWRPPGKNRVRSSGFVWSRRRFTSNCDRDCDDAQYSQRRSIRESTSGLSSRSVSTSVSPSTLIT
ncbi:Poly-gamma-glutamate biosynthesis protein CapA/YwtB (capsule formation), metallophosphatase superfamily [Halogranum amylolyticum]|uniref:Poly-gamma-glutamate biosynthesis protein CapA/YwtB (Capsule formation), metallophosphatase superfamily n=1 Tax=Halogranum amylolyticum TaxID=660520 RepID=A0A1H8SNQ0_9EURY|nr:CapA family protein [Halogranum amylolyticum]SEO80156.1 Poly-gamma-glutamate biosynthesis protein CapA/YwtB (capsule formation), metallophosphatase superfamily [Halogranum amylolyticum]